MFPNSLTHLKPLHCTPSSIISGNGIREEDISTWFYRGRYYVAPTLAKLLIDN
jgi:hypothetical protein